MNHEEEETQSAADDVGFGLEILTRFYTAARERARDALIASGGDHERVDVPNLAASLVPP